MDHDEHSPRCKCGTTRHDRNAVPYCDYSVLGALYLLWGGTAVPKQVRFGCVLCGTEFDRVTDWAERRAFV